jgi:hypothetical protein
MMTAYYRARVKDHADWWCPNGHRQHFLGESEDAKRARRAEARAQGLQDYITHERKMREAAERSNRALKGWATRRRWAAVLSDSTDRKDS